MWRWMVNEVYKYDVVECQSLSLLVKMVNDLIEKGWQPYGGVATLVTPDFVSKVYYLQAIVKE
jgi:hypothetical protein